ncbi:MAG: NAD(P)/FAD-dependent oxidoreductase [Pseudomonadota bacterium]|nr:NAD(P)/FAD-dependent oxidoreductase [Pseudomonadota bacterium]
MTKKIVIIGAGPAGLLAAVYFKQHNIDVTLIGPEPKHTNSMVYALHPSHIKWLHKHLVEVKTKPVSQMILQPLNEQLTLTSAYSAHDSLCETVYHNDLLHALKQARRKLDITWIKGVPSDLNLNSVTINQSGTISRHKATHILACDGTNSWTRSQTPISSSQFNYQQIAHTAIVTHTLKNHDAFQRFDSSGTLAILPTSNPHQSAVIYSCRNHTPAQKKKHELNLALSQLTFLGNIIVSQDHTTTPLISQLSHPFHYRNIYLIGSSGHTMHPLAGIGFNLAITDIKIACEHILANLPSSHYSIKRKRSHQKAHWITHTIANTANLEQFLPLIGLSKHIISLPHTQKRILKHIDNICLY